MKKKNIEINKKADKVFDPPSGLSDQSEAMTEMFAEQFARLCLDYIKYKKRAMAEKKRQHR